MGMLQRLREAHPDVTITAYDGHYCSIGDHDSHLLNHIKVEKDGRTASFEAVESGRRKAPKPKAIEERLKGLITQFA